MFSGRVKSDKIMDEIKKSDVEEFDDLIIDLSKNRILQEITMYASLRTRGGILVAFAGVILGILLSGGWEQLNIIVKERVQGIVAENEPPILFTITLHLQTTGIIAFFVSIILGFVVILPRGRPGMIDPMKINNNLVNSTIKETKHEIKCHLIRDLNHLKNKNSSLGSLARGSYWFLIVGLSALSLMLLFNSSSLIVKIVTGKPF